MSNDMAVNMDLRDYFAAVALTGLIFTDSTMDWPTPSLVAEQAYKYADAMLAARSKP